MHTAHHSHQQTSLYCQRSPPFTPPPSQPSSCTKCSSRQLSQEIRLTHLLQVTREATAIGKVSISTHLCTNLISWSPHATLWISREVNTLSQSSTPYIWSQQHNHQEVGRHICRYGEEQQLLGRLACQLNLRNIISRSLLIIHRISRTENTQPSSCTPTLKPAARTSRGRQVPS